MKPLNPLKLNKEYKFICTDGFSDVYFIKTGIGAIYHRVNFTVRSTSDTDFLETLYNAIKKKCPGRNELWYRHKVYKQLFK